MFGWYVNSKAEAGCGYALLLPMDRIGALLVCCYEVADVMDVRHWYMRILKEPAYGSSKLISSDFSNLSTTSTLSNMADTSTQGNYNTLEQYLKDGSWVDRPEVLPWYTKDLIDLEPKTDELFEIYSKVPPDKVVSHITQIRNKAFKIVSIHIQNMSCES